MPDLVRTSHRGPPRRPLRCTLGVWVRRLLLWLEELDPCLAEDLAAILLHILEALAIDIIAGGVISDGDGAGGKGRDGALAGASSSSTEALARPRAHGGVAGTIIVVGAMGARRGAFAVRGAKLAGRVADGAEIVFI